MGRGLLTPPSVQPWNVAHVFLAVVTQARAQPDAPSLGSALLWVMGTLLPDATPGAHCPAKHGNAGENTDQRNLWVSP